MDIPIQYCESNNLQILNVITSFLFIVFAFLAYKKTKNKVLAILLSFVGLSSAFWHLTSFASADFLDTLSIALFSLAVIYLIFSKVFRNKIYVFLSLVVLILISFFLEGLPFLNGSLVYIFLLFVLLITGIPYSKKVPATKKHLTTALLVFSIAIIFRIADPILCIYIPTGTHFIWHILMSFVGYKLILLFFKKTNKSNP